MRRMQTGEGVAQNAQPRPYGQRFASGVGPTNEPAERVAFHVLHDQEQPERVVPHVQDRHHVRMPDARRELGLLEQIVRELGTFAQVRVGELDGHITLEPTRTPHAAKVHRGHATAGDGEEDFVSADPLGQRGAMAVAARVVHSSCLPFRHASSR